MINIETLGYGIGEMMDCTGRVSFESVLFESDMTNIISRHPLHK
jgi:hypothetical protein